MYNQHQHITQRKYLLDNPHLFWGILRVQEIKLKNIFHVYT